MNKVNALRGCFVFCAMPFMLVAALASSSELRHRRHCAATRSMLVVVVAHAGIVWHATRMLAAPSRLRIAEPDSMHHVRMQLMYAHSGACDSANLAVLYGCQRALLLCSLSGAGRLSGKKLSIFFSHRHRSIHHISLWSAESRAIESIATVRKPWSKVRWVLDWVNTWGPLREPKS